MFFNLWRQETVNPNPIWDKTQIIIKTSSLSLSNLQILNAQKNTKYGKGTMETSHQERIVSKAKLDFS